MAEYVRDRDPRYKQIEEYEFWDEKEGRKVWRCVGCYKKISFKEFREEKGYCMACRDGKNDPLYRMRGWTG